MVNINLSNFSKTIDFVSDFLSDIKKYSNDVNVKQKEIENSIRNEVDKPSLVIDRIEGNTVVCEVVNDRLSNKIQVVHIDRNVLPINIKEGNVLKYNGDKYLIDYESSNLLKKSIENKVKDLWEN